MMKSILKLTLFMSFALFSSLLTGQGTDEVEVSEPRLELAGNILIISYDILGGQAGDSYVVRVEVEDEDGNSIRARSLSGDVGEGISKGRNLQIRWDYERDEVYLDAEIFISVHARRIAPAAEPVREEAVEQPADRPVERDQPSAAPAYNRTGIILQSLAFPGLGLTKVTGQPHWIKGVAAYGCLAGSVVMNRMAISTFESISDQSTDVEIQAQFDKAGQQDQVSEILAYAAIGIWVTDLIWTLVGTSGSKSYAGLPRKGFSLMSAADPVSGGPQLGMIYTF